MERLNLNLKKYAYFSPDLLSAINEIMVQESFKHGSHLLKKGLVNHRVYFILSGVIKILGEEDGKTVIPYILAEDDFGIATDSFFCGDPTEYEIIAEGDVEAVSATREQLLIIGKTYDELEKGINKIQAHYRKQYEKESMKLSKLEPNKKYEWFKTKKSHLVGRLKDEDIMTYLNMSPNAYYKYKNEDYKKNRGKKQ